MVMWNVKLCINAMHSLLSVFTVNICLISCCVVVTGMFITPEKLGVQWFNAASSDNSSEFHLIGMVTEIALIKFIHT